LISGGTVTVSEGVSWVNGGLTVNASRGLTVLGSNTTFTANGPTTINSAVLRAQNGASLHLPEAHAFTSGQLILSNNATATLSALTNVNLTRFLLYSGATFALPPSVTGYSSSGGMGISEQRTIMLAQGAGTRLDLSSLQSLDAVFSGLGGLQQLIVATAGAEIDLSGLSTVTGGGSGANGGGPLEFRTDASSAIHLDALTQFNGSSAGILVNCTGATFDLPLLASAGRTHFQLPAGGELSAPLLASLQICRLTIPDAARFAAPSLTTFANCTLVLSGSGAFEHGELTTVDLSRFLLSAGATYTLPASIQSFSSSDSFGANEQRTLFSATGAGTRLDLSSLTNLTASFSGLGGLRLLVVANSEGEIDLSGLQSVTGGGSGVNGGGPFEFRSDATGKILLSALETAIGTGAGLLFNLAGTNTLGAAELTLANAHLTLPTNSLVSVGTLELLTTAHLSGVGALEGNILNAGVVRPGTSPGRLTIFGNYTQAVTGTFIAEVGGPLAGTQYDQLVVTGHAALDGILDMRLVSNYAPDLTNTFRILDSGSRAGQFSSVVGADAGASVEFAPNYDANGVWLGLIFATGPSVVAASPSGTIAHTLDHFLLTFSEPLTTSTFTTADVSMVGPAGTITVNAPQFLSNTVWRLSFAAQILPGEYTLTVGPAINDLAGNPMNQNGDQINDGEDDQFIHTVTVPAAMDFAVTAILSPDTAAVGTPVQLVWTVSNESTNAANGSRTDAVYLSTDRVVGNDVWLGEFTTTQGLDAGESRSVTNQIVLPVGTTGTRYFIVVADSSREWFELTETNNTFISTNATIVSAADLTVTSVTASTSAAQFGETVTVTWVVRNGGAAPAGATWRDRLYLSPTASVTTQSIVLPPDHDGGPLAAGASYTNSAVVTLPLASGLTAGTYYLVVAADVNNAQAEANEANNLGNRSIALTVPPLPDLLPSAVAVNVSSQPIVLPGESVEITWSVTNAGTASATGGWTEAVYVAEVVTNSTAVLLGRFHFTNDLAIGAALTRTQTVVLPPTALAGEIWFGVLVDSEAMVVESNETNNAAWSDATTFVPPALTVTLPVSSVAENTGNPALTALVQRNGSQSNALEVALASSHTNKLFMPPTVTIPAGQASATFTATILWDNLPDPDLTVMVTASATGFTNGVASLEVRNVDLPQLTLLPAQGAIMEGDAVTVTVSRSPATDQPLLVKLSSHSPTDLVTPVSVTIPAFSNSVSFLAAAPDDTLIEPPRAVTLTANAAGHVSAATTVTVLDDDLPQIVLLLNPPSVAENAGPGAVIGTVVRLSVTSREVTVQLASSDTNSVAVPYLVTIPPNEAAASFALDVLDDDLINGTRTVDILAWVTDSLGGGRIGEPFTNQLTITDDDGPALWITLPRPLLPEGSNQLATVTRNTPATNDLFVTLLSSDPGEATVPASVVIPIGTNAATFLVSAVEDGTPDGTRSVTLTASAAGHEPGLAVLQVTDINLPDLVLTEVGGPAAGFTKELVSLSFRVANYGLAPLTNPFVQRVWLSDDPLPGDDTLVGEFTFNQAGESIASGLSFQQTVSAFLPQQPGDYWVIVTADALNAVVEIDEYNNTRISAAPIQVAAEYSATVQTDVTTAPAGTLVPLTGQVTMANGQSPEGRLVSIHIERGGFRRVIGALAQADGSFAVNFRPLPNEAGVYTIGAAHPGEATAPVQDTFTLLGAKFDPVSLALTLAPDASVGGSVTFRNLGDAPLAGLTVTPVSVPANLNVLATLATNTLPANGAVSASYGIAVTASEPASGEFTLRVTSAEGVTVDLPVNVTIRPLQAQLVALPASLEAGMLVGGQKLVAFEVVNQGGATSGPVQVVLPQVPWLTVADANPLPPLAPGETNVVTLQLTPPANLPLTAYDGQLAILGGASAVPVPFRFIALSEARGALAVLVEDENTYYAAGQPRVAGAAVRLFDPFSGGLIAETTSDINGAALFADLAEGPYTLRVEAAQHDTFSSPVTVAAGLTNSVRAFVAVQTVAYRWTVVPTEVPDRYRMSLETTFEANVPWPVVTVDQPLIVPLVFPGEVTQMEITLTNHGLIAAQGVQFNVRDTATYKITPLIRDIGELPARSSITIPVLIQLQPEIDAQAVEAIRLHTEPGATPAGRVRAADGGWGFGDECEYPEMEAYYFMICGGDRKWHLVKVDIRPLLAVKELAGCAKSIVENAPNLIKSPVAGAMGMICDCLIPAAKKLGEWMGVPTNTKAMECVCAAIGLDIAGMAKCVCYKGEFTVPKPPTGEGGGGSVHINPVSFETGDCIPGMIVPLGSGPLGPAQAQGEVRAASGDDSGVCAQVRLRLDQDLVLTRNAFRATLEIENRTPDISLADMSLRLDFYDGNGENAANRLIVTATNLTGLTAVDGSGVVLSNTTGVAEFLILPTTDAAPFGPAPYLVGGELRYTRDGQQFLIPLNPAPITVLPEPSLTVRYFHQRDVFSDDPRTPEIEPAIPYALGMIVQNHGAGTARSVRITSGQPQIVDNEKGLLIDFQLIASEVAGQNLTPSLTVNLGDIAPGANAIAKWLFTSSLQGLFIDYQATFEHLDGLGNPRLSLVDTVEIHEMIRSVRAPFGDALPDFLVNDVPDEEDLPDTVYLSDGSVQPVAVVRNATVDHTPSATNLTVSLVAPLPAGGFGYLRVPDPQGATGARQYQLVGLSRAGGATLPPENFWQTDRTFIGLGRPPVRENLLHLFDHDSTGQYVLTYAPVATSDTTPPTSAIAALPAESYPQIPLQWSGADDPGGSGLAGFDIWVSENGGPFTRWLEGTLLTSAFYPGVSGQTYAFYSTAVDQAGNREPVPGAPDAQTTVSLLNTAPTLSLGPDQTVDEGQIVVIVSEASDSDAGQTLTFSLLSAPPNATIHPATGIITWPTGETDGPGTNLFVARAVDNGLPSLSATASVTVIVREVNSPPLLALLADHTIPEGFTLLVTNVATDLDLPANTLTFSFGAAPPPGASLDPVNGLFHWRPTETQGPSTNLVSVVVTDNGVPPLNATQSFTVIVLDVLSDVALSAGNTNLLAGERVAVPLVLDSTLDATNINFILATDAQRLTNLTVQAVTAEVISLQVTELDPGQLAVNVGLNPALRAATRRPIVSLTLSAMTNRGSAIVPITLSDLQARRANGETVAHTVVKPGYVIVVEREPVLLMSHAQSPVLTLFGLPGRHYAFLASTNLESGAVWTEFHRLQLAGRSTNLSAALLPAPPRFFRALEVSETSPRLELMHLGGNQFALRLEGELGASYTLQTVTQLAGAETWSNLATLVLTNSPATFYWTNQDAAQRFFRARTP
jgi:subtilase family serine protease